MSNKLKKVMDTIKWVNDTFVPLGLKPIEDLPKGIPGKGESCVIAQILHEVPDFANAFVGTNRIELNTPLLEQGWVDTEIMNKFTFENEFGIAKEDEIDLPMYIKEFIESYDKGDYPELLNLEETVEYHGEHDAAQIYNIHWQEDKFIVTDNCPNPYDCGCDIHSNPENN